MVKMHIDKVFLACSIKFYCRNGPWYDYWFFSGDSFHGYSSTKLQKVFLHFSPFLFLVFINFSLANVQFIVSHFFFSEWGANLLVSLCDTRLSCNNMLSSITGSCLSHWLSLWFLISEKYVIQSSRARLWIFMLNLAVCWECYWLIQLWQLHSIVSLIELNRLFYPNSILHIVEFSDTIVGGRTKSKMDWFLCFLLDLSYVCLVIHWWSWVILSLWFINRRVCMTWKGKDNCFLYASWKDFSIFFPPIPH